MSYYTLGLSDSIDDSFELRIAELYNKVGQNSGNLAFHFGVTRMLGPSAATYHWGEQPNVLNLHKGVCVIPCANQLGPHADMGSFADRLADLKGSIAAVGLGAQASASFDEIPDVPIGTIKWVEQIVAHAATTKPNITVRGDYTKSVLDHFGFGHAAISLGCPSFLINSSDRLGVDLEKRYKAPFKRIAVAAGHPSHVGLAAIERSLVDLMGRTGGMYITQATWELLAMSRGETHTVPRDFLDKCRAYLRPDLDIGRFEEWVGKYFCAFYNVPAWIEYLRRFDVVIGCRIHGVIMAIQAGVPGICIAYDSRIRELCERSSIPYLLPKDVKAGIRLDTLSDLVEFNGAEFDKNRAALRHGYTEFWNSNGLSTKENTRSFAAA